MDLEEPIIIDKVEVNQKTCYHCGEPVRNTNNVIEDKQFCCSGCKTVYEIINENDLCDYYSIDETPGLKQDKQIRKGKFDLLESDEVKSKLITFKDQNHSHVVFYLPQIHCSSCIWILEHLNRINPDIIKSQVNFLKREITVIYNHHRTDLKVVAENLALIGYEPHVSLNDIDGKKIKKYDASKILKLGIAGFCFGNIMMLSFPEYFAIAEEGDLKLKSLFAYLNLALSLPVFFYCSADFFVSGYKGIKQSFLNIDAPIALAILITFGRSVFEILTDTGAGYLDSMSGIVFFMLIGRYVQTRTYDTISFDRDFKSYFPLGITIIENEHEIQKPVSSIKVGDIIKIHNDEIIPADGILFLGKAEIDYSFVTGESKPISKNIGELVYAGGKQVNAAIQLKVVKEVTQSYLTKLWNTEAFRAGAKEDPHQSFIHKLSKYFTYILFSIAIVSAIYWSIYDSSKVWSAVTAVLIVACPCALLLSATFTNGNFIRILNKYGLYVKNERTIEALSKITSIVFDKTGTITEQGESTVTFEGKALTNYQSRLIKSLTYASNHPLSRDIYKYLPITKLFPINFYKQHLGMGVSGQIDDHLIEIGSSSFIGIKSDTKFDGSFVHIKIDGEYLGGFRINNKYRTGLNQIIKKLAQSYRLKLVSGDNELERPYLETLFPKKTELLFNQKPLHKLDVIKAAQQRGEKVLMVGDGLNDAGALKQSDVGLAISDNSNNFSPACDAILLGSNFKLLDSLIRFANKQKFIINASFILSILYNVIGLSFAVQGILMPVVAAILMPISSLSIIFLTTILSSFFEKRLLNDKNHF
ncbi:MAG: heavy metal translocating P-type ATPase metal-binding domain-containing protein [Bacteroidetes bacterium]|nr:heavy metal translocating P-type ATPase metal-binding domain-containing protein [Bacteroidota bacterium]MCA6444419.1 heavy metal translocating P-type ATPase metal-binding domain-containing protein [Bacteroidota bacterium]